MSMTFSGSGTITGLVAGGLPDATITADDLTTGHPTWDTSGNLGIGTASPVNDGGGTSKVLHINASGAGEWAVTRYTNGSTGSSSSNGFIVGNIGADGYIYNYANGNLVFATNGSERMRLDSYGSLLVGTTSNASNRTGLVICPSIYNLNTSSGANVVVSSAGELLRSTSSIKYKHDVTDTTHGLADVLKLRPVMYKGNNDGDTIFGGLIAEEVHEIGLTEFVQYAEDNTPDALSYGNMVSLAFKAIQEQQAMIASQQTTIESLTERIAALEGDK